MCNTKVNKRLYLIFSIFLLYFKFDSHNNDDVKNNLLDSRKCKITLLFSNFINMTFVIYYRVTFYGTNTIHTKHF